MSRDREGINMLVAGKDFPWEYVAGFCLLFSELFSFAEVVGHTVQGSKAFGAYGVASVELPNPDIDANQRMLRLPIENKSDFKSITYAQLDSGVIAGKNELILLFENRKGLFGGRKPSIHVAVFPAGTWLDFFEAVTNYKGADYQWPHALGLYQPGDFTAFHASRNLFMP